MLKPRIIPCLLIHNGGLVKTQKFHSPKYVGDPINAVKIFNEKETDELMVIDIDASANKVEPNYALIAKLAAECRMPLCYGGGITTAEQATRIIGLGVEKISLSSTAINSPLTLGKIASAIGSQSTVVVLDVKKKMGVFNKGYEIYTNNGRAVHKADLLATVQQMQEFGAGEIVINNIDLDGAMQGYDLVLAKKVSKVARTPLTFLGGAGSLDDISNLFSTCGLVGAAAGSLFVFKGKYRAVLINYPSKQQKQDIFSKSGH